MEHKSWCIKNMGSPHCDCKKAATVSDSPELAGCVLGELLAAFMKTRQRLYVQARTNEDYLFVSYCDSIIKKYKKTDDCSS